MDHNDLEEAAAKVEEMMGERPVNAIAMAEFTHEKIHEKIKDQLNYHHGEDLTVNITKIRGMKVYTHSRLPEDLIYFFDTEDRASRFINYFDLSLKYVNPEMSVEDLANLCGNAVNTEPLTMLRPLEKIEVMPDYTPEDRIDHTIRYYGGRVFL